jgi:hypothetical protein
MSPDPGHAGADPENPQSWNLYVYVRNDAINSTDPTGLFPWGELVEAGIQFGGLFLFGELSEEDDRHLAFQSQRGSPRRRTAEDLNNAFTEASNALVNPICSALFNTSRRGTDPVDALRDLFNRPTIFSVGVGRIAPMRDSNGRSLDLGLVAATTQRTRGFVVNAQDTKVFQWGATIIFNEDYSGEIRMAHTLLHELGHVYNLDGVGLGGSRIDDDSSNIPNNLTISERNARLVAGSCPIR